MPNQALTTGADNVKRVLTALGGNPPVAAGVPAIQSITRQFTEKFEHRQRVRAERERLTEPIRATLLQPFVGNTAIAEAARKFGETFQLRRPGRGHHRATAPKVEPRIVAGSILTLAAAPYNGAPMQLTLGGATTDAAEGDGYFDLQCATGNGGSQAAVSGVSNWFWSVAQTPNDANPMGTRLGVAAYTDYGWYDWSAISTAHSDGTYELWVWGVGEETWVAQTPVSPSWSDGSSGFDSHGSDGGTGNLVSNSLAWETYFPTWANSWYQAFVLANGSCDSNSWDLIGQSGSAAYLDATVRLMVFAQ